jgi:hypothetical protein
LVILGGWKTCVVHTTTRNSDGRVWIVSTLSMKRETKCPESQLFVVVIGEVDEGGVGTPILPTLADVLDEFAINV